MLDATTSVYKKVCEDLLRITGALDLTEALDMVRLMKPGPPRKGFNMAWGEVQAGYDDAFTREPVEVRRLDALVTFADGRTRVFGASQMLDPVRLLHSSDPDKLRDHADNRMRNDIMEMVVRFT